MQMTLQAPFRKTNDLLPNRAVKAQRQPGASQLHPAVSNGAKSASKLVISNNKNIVRNPNPYKDKRGAADSGKQFPILQNYGNLKQEKHTKPIPNLNLKNSSLKNLNNIQVNFYIQNTIVPTKPAEPQARLDSADPGKHSKAKLEPLGERSSLPLVQDIVVASSKGSKKQADRLKP